MNKQDIGAVLHDSGASFRVWAPFATSVAVIGTFNNWSKTDMQSEGDGYWFVDVPGAKAGHEYKFVMTNDRGECTKNDPRALQVTTAEGNSVVVDPKFDWSGDNFAVPVANQQVIYEMHMGTFSRTDASTIGTFHDAAARLDYLADLGVNVIELMPIGTMPKDRGWGYATDYIYAVESLYGGRRQFLEFIKAAHQKGIGVILDVVYNHFGPEGLDLWQFDGWSEDGKGGIYFYNDWRSTTPWGETRPDYGRPEVRQYITDNVRMWMHDCHLDGLRVDSTINIRKVSDQGEDLPDGWKMLQEITTTVKEIKPEAIVIAEDVSGNEYITKSVSDGGAGFTAQWEVGLPHLLRDALDVVNDSDRNMQLIRELLGRRYNDDAFQRVIYSDSHDTAAYGRGRLNEEIAPGEADNLFARKRSLLAAAIIMTAPGIPMLLQGQEFMQGGNFNDWQALEWDRAERFKGIVQAHHDLIALRKNIDGKTRGLVGQSVNLLHENDNDKVVAYHRWDQGGAGDDVVIIINFENKAFENYQLQFPRSGNWKVRFNSDWKGYSDDFHDENITDAQVDFDTGSVNLGPYSVLVLSQD